jgi:uncharacterized protein (TIGR02145 family)
MLKNNIMIRYSFFSFVVVSLILLGCAQKGGDEPKADAKFSSDGQSVTIGKQVWMTRNLNVSSFRNGDPIPHAKTDEEWQRAGQKGQPAWCYCNNDPANGEKYGKLYNWYAVNDPRGLAPKGWHIPSGREWTVLTNYLGGAKEAGTKMKSKQGWPKGGNGTNSSGFSGLPGDYRMEDGTFMSNFFDSNGSWWSSTEESTYIAWYRYLVYDRGAAERWHSGKSYGLSVRCLRD